MGEGRYIVTFGRGFITQTSVERERNNRSLSRMNNGPNEEAETESKCWKFQA